MDNFTKYFLQEEHAKINTARQDHLDSIGLDLHRKTVLEVGAGIGLHSRFFLERDCEMTITDGFAENVQEIQRRYPHVKSRVLDVESDCLPTDLDMHDIVYCYGLLYHVDDVEVALANLSKVCKEMILIETKVSVDRDNKIERMRDHKGNTGSIHGLASRPTRAWMMSKLQQYFGYSYTTISQPDYRDFPVDWDDAKGNNNRAVFIGSRTPLTLPSLSDQLVQKHKILV